MKVNREQFVSRLEIVCRAAGTNRRWLAHKYLQINRGTIWAINGVMVVRTELPCAGDFEGGILGTDLLGLLRSVDSEMVELIAEGQSIRVKTGRVEAVFPNQPLGYVTTVVTPDCKCSDRNAISRLVDGLVSCKPAVSRVSEDGALCGVLLDGDILQSTDADRTRIAFWSLPTGFAGMRGVIPTKLINVMSRVKDEIAAVGYAADARTFVVTLHDGTYISSVTHAGEYPDLRVYLPKPNEPSVRVTCGEQIVDAIKMHVALLKGVKPSDAGITIRLCNGKCILVSQRGNAARLQETLKASCDIDHPIEFEVNLRYLRDVAKLCSDFTYFTEAGILLIESGDLRYLLRVERRDNTASHTGASLACLSAEVS